MASEAILRQVLADEQGEFTTAMNYLQQSLEILQQLQSSDAENLRDIIANVRQMAAAN